MQVRFINKHVHSTHRFLKVCKKKSYLRAVHRGDKYGEMYILSPFCGGHEHVHTHNCLQERICDPAVGNAIRSQTPAVSSFREPSHPTVHNSRGSSQPKIDYVSIKARLFLPTSGQL